MSALLRKIHIAFMSYNMVPREIYDIRHKPPTVAFFGHFGAGNFGNESTLQAMLYHLRRLVPGVRVKCICTGPENVTRAYGIDAGPINPVVGKPWNQSKLLPRVMHTVLVGIPREGYRLLKGVAELRDAKMLIVVGTGLLTDAFGNRAWGPYSTFKWSLIAKLCGCRLAFVSVGAGPLESRTGRICVKSALSLASFRSYRDEATLKYLRSIGFEANGDCVVPDLAFSLPLETRGSGGANVRRPTVGLGLMLYEGMCGIEKTTETHYDAYLDTLANFAMWLLDRGYDIRLLSGDLSDSPVVRDFMALLRERQNAGNEATVIAEPIGSAKDLISQIAATDFVVATRFHNVLLALFLNKPSISISFHHKCSSLMEQMGMSEYCQDIRHLDGKKLMEQFGLLETNASVLKLALRIKVTECQRILDGQYRTIIQDLTRSDLSSSLRRHSSQEEQRNAAS